MEYKECKKCPGYCCMMNDGLRTPVTDEDIVRIADYLQIPIDNFVRDFIVRTHGRLHYENAPTAMAHIRALRVCPFLRQGLCGINSVKPKACQAEKPASLVPSLNCAEWHKLRLGWLSTQ